MNTMVHILQAGNLILAFLAPSLEFAFRVKTLLELDPDMKVNVTKLTGEAIAADDEAQRIIAEWKAKHGLS